MCIRSAQHLRAGCHMPVDVLLVYASRDSRLYVVLALQECIEALLGAEPCATGPGRDKP